jgi:hypothetical protein
MPFDVQGARAAGYSDKEIADHLAQDSKFDLAGARKAGYSDSEIIGHLSAPQPAASQIPVSAMEREYSARQPTPAPKPADPTLVDKILGAGEAAGSLATGIVGGTLGTIGGTLGGLAGAVATGDFGTPQAARQIEQAAGEGMSGLTYAPRTEAGRQQTEAVGNAMAATLPVVPLTAEVGALGRGAAGVAGAARDLSAGTAARVGTAATNAVERLRQASPEIAARVQRTLGRHPEPTPGTAGSVGAAGTDMATQRHALADSLPVPIELTAGEASREPIPLRFENEVAKQEIGAPLRERALDTNKKISQNFDNYVDQTGTTTTDKTEAAKSAVNVIRKEAARDKAEIRVAYTNAEKSAEGVAPVQLDGVVDFLNESAPDQAVSKVLEAARKRALQLGIAAEDEAGNLVPMDTTVKNAERFRRAIGEATDYEPTNIRNAAMMKGLIDSQTEAVAGPLYRTARRLRENYANKYENRAVIGDLIENKRGSKDRKVALEHVFDRAILNGDRAELSHLRAVLQTAGEDGKQAWKDLQGTTAQWLKDEAFKNSATDATGAPIASYARLKTAIDKLERGKRLDFIFGKQGAQQVRDLAEVVSYVKTAPPGFINSSNTASTILAALGEAGATGALTGIPVPVLSLMRLLAKHAKNRALEKRITQALHPRRQP